jgi:hypothetical protein
MIGSRSGRTLSGDQQYPGAFRPARRARHAAPSPANHKEVLMNPKWLRSAAVLLILILGCDEPLRLPTSPTPPSQPAPPPVSNTEVWIGGAVLNSDGHCLPDAVVVMTEGRYAGTEARNDCTMQSGYFNGSYFTGYRFTGMRDHDVVTLRAVAKGYVTQEVRLPVVPDMDGWFIHPFYLSKE